MRSTPLRIAVAVAAAVAGTSLCLAGNAADAQPVQPAPGAEAASGQSPKTRYASELARARELVDRGRYAQALGHYEPLLAQRPDDDDLLIEVARVLGFADRNAESADAYRRSLAWQTLWSGEAACAEAWFLESAALDAQPADAWRGVAEARQQREDLRGALDAYREALRLDPDDATNARRAAQILVWLGRTDEGVAAFEALLARDPEDRRSRLGLARALNDAGRHRAAVLEYRNAQIAPLDDETRFDYARALSWAGFDDLADRELATE